MDKIFLRGLDIQTVIGIWDWERRIKQRVRLDLEIGTDVRRAAAADSIEVALDYKAIAKRLIGFTEQSEFQLVESLAEALAKIVIAEFGAAWVKVSVAKPGAIEGAQDVGILIERNTDDYV